MRSRDAFAGGFLAGIVEGKSLEESVDMGHWLASLSIRELGPSYVLNLLLQQQAKTPLSNTIPSFLNPYPSVVLFPQIGRYTSIPSASPILPDHDQQLTSSTTRYPYPKHTYQASKA